MSNYPIFLELDDRLVLVVGGGTVGCRKARGLLAAGARVRMVTVDPPVEELTSDRLELRHKVFSTEDLDGVRLAFAATGHPQTDNWVLATAHQRNILVNLAANRSNGDFHLPAIVRRGDLLLAVATSGQAPALSSILRQQLETDYGPEWATLVKIAAALRSRMLTADKEKPYSYKVLEKLLAGGLVDLVADRRTEAINQLLTRVLGQEMTLAQLGLCLRDDSP